MACYGTQPVWIGGKDDLIEGQWTWYNSTSPENPITKFYWGSKQPNNNNNQDCLAYYKLNEYKWADEDYYTLLKVTLTVKDVNDEKPRFINEPRPFLATVSTNPSIGELVYELMADDADTGSSITYILESAGEGKVCTTKIIAAWTPIWPIKQSSQTFHPRLHDENTDYDGTITKFFPVRMKGANINIVTMSRRWESGIPYRAMDYEASAHQFFTHLRARTRIRQDC
ncbi:Hypothetical predicted protein [Mytilus galloprovincialis]|uniref:C-type lectin domain-containing protein n=1 Tax=Mytilus galloprovincialis TaxID=29158 RepID=A0A8B6BRQ5_MYTGA|nr:Hypothetical predicted protein [Mytilus galloprovincialis]